MIDSTYQDKSFRHKHEINPSRTESYISDLLNPSSKTGSKITSNHGSGAISVNDKSSSN